MSNGKSVFSCTRQQWKVLVFSVCVAIFVLTIVLHTWFNEWFSPLSQLLLDWTGFFSGLAGFAFACLSIACPVCGARWFWMAISKKPSDVGFKWFLRLEECPVCKSTCREMLRKLQ